MGVETGIVVLEGSEIELNIFKQVADMASQLGFK